MKKMMKTMAIAALTLLLAACGGNKGGAQSSTETTDNKVSYITYTNEKFGYSVEVPDYLSKRETLDEESGTIFSDDGPEGFTLNRIDIGAYESILVEEYTPEKVKEEFEEEVAKRGDDITSKECGDNYYTFSSEGEYINEIYHVTFKGNVSLHVIICYQPESASKFAGEVADHIIKSAKFN